LYSKKFWNLHKQFITPRKEQTKMGLLKGTENAAEPTVSAVRCEETLTNALMSK
jgi:hypothetical protein